MTQTFTYKALNSQGQVQTGTITAQHETQAAMRLQSQGLIPLRVHLPGDEGGSAARTAPRRQPPKPPKPQMQTGLKKGWSQSRLSSFLAVLNRDMGSAPWSRVRRSDLISFAEDLAVLLGSGIPLNRSLSVVSELTSKDNFQGVILDVQQRIREGSTFWEALQSHHKIFPPVFIQMVQAGEAGGVLEGVLQKVADYLNSVEELKEYLVTAMIYPAVLTLTAGGSIAVLLLFVIPKFASIFSDMGVALPLATQVLLTLGETLRNIWWLIGLVLVAGLAGFRYVLRTKQGRTLWDRFKLRIPLIGTMLKKMEIARFVRTLGTLLSSGVSILSAMNIVQGVVLNTVLQRSLTEVYADLKQGRVLSRALENSRIFPVLTIQMVGVGEETGRMDEMLEKISDIYEKEVRAGIKKFTSLFEPLIILLLGGIIGLMVVSMLMAIFSVNSLAM